MLVSLRHGKQDTKSVLYCTSLNLEEMKNGYVKEKKWFVTYFFQTFFDGIQTYSGVFVVTV